MMRRWHSATLRVALSTLGALIFAPTLSGAADLVVSPMRIELSMQRRTAAINIRNNSKQATTIRIQALAWSQLNGKHLYSPTRELLVSPRDVTIAPGGVQIARMALMRQPDADGELAYRIVLEALPANIKSEDAAPQSALRLVIPAFVQSQSGASAAKLAWTMEHLPGNRLKLTLHNAGNAHVEVFDFALYVPGTDKPLAGASVSTHVLAGQFSEWALDTDTADPTSTARFRLKAYTDAGNVDIEISPAKP
jgi:fimbrial chaperone protein